MSAFSSPRILVGFVLLLSGSTSALAADGQAFADRLKELMSGQSANLSFSGVTNEGEDVVLNAATITPSGPGATPVSLGDLRFEGVTGSTAEGWRSNRVALNDVDQADDGVRTTVTGTTIEGLQLKGASETTAALSPVFFERATVGGVGVEKDGKSVVSVQDIQLQNEGTNDSGYRSNFTLGKFLIDTTAAGEAEGAAVMTELGYPQISGDINGSAAWNPQSGALTLDPLQVEVENAGELSFAYTITGYTPSFIQSLAQLSDQMKASGGQADGSGMAIIGLVSQLYLQSAQLSFEDRSLTNRLLEYFAKQNNQTRDQLIASLTSMMPIALSYLQNPEFQTEVSSAVQSFLNDPKSLRIAIAPQAPVPATQIIGAAMGAPQTLPQVLNLSVQSGN